jgi:predicted metal-dependent hydrolase
MGNEEILLRVVKQLTFLNLLKSPEDTVDYVVLYALSHWKILEHSHRYWDLVKKYVPN